MRLKSGGVLGLGIVTLIVALGAAGWAEAQSGLEVAKKRGRLVVGEDGLPAVRLCG